ncbi:hypothetical protein BaRGS_00021283 [Batillaria attramentaria]|uniref:Uncharacterized protein n=1 Tax=Batillaria attramentaria TaxID=370345 RepID=A0ABD0KK39_9CAEN
MNPLKAKRLQEMIRFRNATPQSKLDETQKYTNRFCYPRSCSLVQDTVKRGLTCRSNTNLLHWSADFDSGHLGNSSTLRRRASSVRGRTNVDKKTL